MIIIDVRDAEEFARGHVTGAINITPRQLVEGASDLDGVDKDEPIIVYCRTGSRSAVAIEILTEHGFTHVTNGINLQHTTALLAKQ